ncbi:MAG TPA: hypothetical protein PLG34_06140 [Spirochaetota bacterium]|jgi:hypothetical protein|nr:MAG: hypothetical protein BWX91_01880 [Spirochaetes bacterium ADurb.Bin133]HNZ26287.1 hypothetical protein [Spirochaetota bacterium]HPY87542.1 hypothetical protein [Spirochaetota bacterium]
MKSKKIDEIIKNEIEETKNLWAIIEKKWSIEDNIFIMKNEWSNPNEIISNNKQGILLIKDDEIRNFKEWEKSNKIYFFNKDYQVFCLADEDNPGSFFYNKNEIKKVENNLIEPENITKDDKRRFEFAVRIGTIPKNLEKNSIKILVNEENNKWRFYHE